MSKLPPCPNCGENWAVFVRAQAKGPATITIFPDGEEEVYNEEVWYQLGKVVRCEGCRKLRRDLSIINNEVVVKNE